MTRFVLMLLLLVGCSVQDAPAPHTYNEGFRDGYAQSHSEQANHVVPSGPVSKDLCFDYLAVSQCAIAQFPDPWHTGCLEYRDVVLGLDAGHYIPLSRTVVFVDDPADKTRTPSVFSDPVCRDAMPNPTMTASDGTLHFFMKPGAYTLRFEKQGWNFDTFQKPVLLLVALD